MYNVTNVNIISLCIKEENVIKKYVYIVNVVFLIIIKQHITLDLMWQTLFIQCVLITLTVNETALIFSDTLNNIINEVN